MSDLFAAKAIALVAVNLKTVYTSGATAPEARYNMALAAAMALGSGWLTATTGKRGQLAHGLAYPLQDMSSPAISHGVSVALLLPHVMAFNAAADRGKFSHMAKLMGADTSGMTLSQAAVQASATVRELSLAVDMPQRMRDVGIKRTAIPQMVDHVMAKRRSHADYNCRPATREDVAHIYESAY